MRLAIGLRYILIHVEHFLPQLSDLVLSRAGFIVSPHRLANIRLLTLIQATLYESPIYILNEDTHSVTHAIGVSRTAFKDEFRQNLVSHSWSVLKYIEYICDINLLKPFPPAIFSFLCLAQTPHLISMSAREIKHFHALDITSLSRRAIHAAASHHPPHRPQRPLLPHHPHYRLDLVPHI